MSSQVNIAHFRQWDQAHWRSFFKAYERLWSLPSENVPLLKSPEFQETMMKVGVFGDGRLFDETPCIWDCETNLGDTNSWTSNASHVPEGPLTVTSLATKVLADNDRALENGDVQLGCYGIIVQARDFGPVVFLKRQAGWCAPCLAGRERSRSFWSIVDRVTSVFRTFDLAAEVFEQEEKRKTHTKDLLTPLLPPPVAELVCIYASNLPRDKRAHEKRELRNLTYRTFEKAAQNLLPEERRDRLSLDRMLKVDPTKLKIISASIVQYMGDHEEESSS